jgi:hypothetical protein
LQNWSLNSQRENNRDEARTDRGKYWEPGATTMSDLSQFVIVAGFGALCFGCGYLIAFIVTRNRWRDDMIKRGVARYNWKTGKWEWGEPPKESKY